MSIRYSIKGGIWRMLDLSGNAHKTIDTHTWYHNQGDDEIGFTLVKAIKSG